jgi:hypothetical protein
MDDYSVRAWAFDFGRGKWNLALTPSDSRWVSLGLPLARRRVLELGAGIGDHTTFFLDRDCEVCVSDGHAENVDFLRQRYHWMRVKIIELEQPLRFNDPLKSFTAMVSFTITDSPATFRHVADGRAGDGGVNEHFAWTEPSYSGHL